MKRVLPIKKVSAELDVLRFPAAVERPVRARCVDCSLPLSLSQPDMNLPERLLGVCAMQALVTHRPDTRPHRRDLVPAARYRADPPDLFRAAVKRGLQNKDALQMSLVTLEGRTL